MSRRIPGRCYFCGDPVAIGVWFCAAHMWAEGLVLDPRESADYLTPEHRWWIERFSREEIVVMGGYLERPAYDLRRLAEQELVG